MGLDLIKLSEYKAYTGIASTNQDAAIITTIPKVSALVKAVCRTTFVDYVEEVKVEVFKGGEEVLQLKETPLIALQGVEFSEDYGSSYTSLTEFKDYAVDTETGGVSLIALPYAKYKRLNAFRVTYTAGYETVPQDLKLAVMDLVTYYLRNDAAVHSTKAVGSSSVQIEYITNTSLPAHIRRVLDLYSANYL